MAKPIKVLKTKNGHNFKSPIGYTEMVVGIKETTKVVFKVVSPDHIKENKDLKLTY